MGEIVRGALAPLGNSEHPFCGRMWVRSFEHGACEMVYCASDKGPSQAEQFNAWLQEAGIDARVRSRDLNPLAGMGGGDFDRPEPTDEENRARATRRARQRLRYSAKAVGADRMLTLTVRENMVDLAESKACLARFNAACRRVWRNWKYVGAPERQERGAWHWHLAIRGWVDVHRLRLLWWRALGARARWVNGKPVLPAGVESPGNIDLRAPRSRGQARRTWHVDSICAYLCKYMSKELGEGSDGGATYSASRGLTWTVERYVVRGYSFDDVALVWLQALETVGLERPYVYQDAGREVLWAAGSTATPL